MATTTAAEQLAKAAIPTMTQVCIRCHHDLPLTEFPKCWSRTAQAHMPAKSCKQCVQYRRRATLVANGWCGDPSPAEIAEWKARLNREEYERKGSPVRCATLD